MHLIGKPETEFTGQVHINFTQNICILVHDTYTYIYMYMYIYICIYMYHVLCVVVITIIVVL